MPSNLFVACTHCRRVKTRCLRVEGSNRCKRCQARSLECIREGHKRGRKLGTKLKRKSPLTGAGTPTSHGQLDPDGKINHFENLVNSNYLDPLNDSVESNLFRPRAQTFLPFRQSKPWPRPELFAMKDILDLGDEAANNVSLVTSVTNISLEMGEDPIKSGLIKLPVARSLFDSFMLYLNPFINLLDHQLHTWDYVRGRSSVLFSAILTAAAKAIYPSIYDRLLLHSEALQKEAIGSLQHSIELIQALIISIHWKNKQDNRMPRKIGYAIRSALEMGYQHCEIQPPAMNSREWRSRERLWLHLFFLDRSCSIQFGLPYMIPLDDFIQGSNKWLDVVPGRAPPSSGDAMTVALVQLRIIGSDMLSLVNGSRLCRKKPKLPCAQTSLDILEKRRQAWEQEIEKFRNTLLPCQAFMLKLYGKHLQLLLSMVQWQLSQRQRRQQCEAAGTCVERALDLIKLMEKPQPPDVLYYAQDSFHVMTAFAATIIIRSLALIPNNGNNGALAVLKNVSQTFASGGLAHNNCTQHAHFIDKLIARYRQRETDASAHFSENHDVVPPHLTHSEDGMQCEEDLHQILGADPSLFLFGPGGSGGIGMLSSSWWPQSQIPEEEPWSSFSISERLSPLNADWNTDNFGNEQSREQ